MNFTSAEMVGLEEVVAISLRAPRSFCVLTSPTPRGVVVGLVDMQGKRSLCYQEEFISDEADSELGLFLSRVIRRMNGAALAMCEYPERFRTIDSR